MTFTPEVLVTAMSQSTVTTVLEVVGLKAGLYFIAAEGCPFVSGGSGGGSEGEAKSAGSNFTHPH